MTLDENPFASPPNADSLTDGFERDRHRYRSLRGRATVASALYAFNTLAYLGTFVAWLLLWQLLVQAQQGQPVEEETLVQSDSRTQLVEMLSIVVRLASFVALLAWMYRAHANLPAFGAQGLRYSPGWTIGAFFIPFLNLYKPFSVAKEIEQVSNPRSDGSGPDRWNQSRASASLILWWIAWIGSAIFSRVISADTSARLPALITAAKMHMAAGLFSAGSAALTIIVVQRITRFQEARATAEVDGKRWRKRCLTRMALELL